MTHNKILNKLIRAIKIRVAANPSATVLQVLPSIIEEVDLYIVVDHHKTI